MAGRWNLTNAQVRMLRRLKGTTYETPNDITGRINIVATALAARDLIARNHGDGITTPGGSIVGWWYITIEGERELALIDAAEAALAREK